jgi:hypothetical protein
MQSAKQALIRCETLDLFTTAAFLEPALAATEPDAGAVQSSNVGFLFRIRPEDQLDLFRHSQAEIAAAALRQALRDRDVERGLGQLRSLRKVPAYRQFVADAELCVELIERRDPRWLDPALAVPWIEAELRPAAERCVQRDASLLVRPALMGLLERCEPCRFDPDCRHAHPAYLWQLLGQPAQAVTALELDPHWCEQADSLIWHAELSEQASLQERVHADLVELCLAWPDAAESWLSASRAWAVRWSAWCDLDDALPMHAFPAWIRLTRATEFPPLPASDQRPGAQLLHVANQLAGNMTDLTLRRSLNALCPALLAAFLAERSRHGVAPAP